MPFPSPSSSSSRPFCPPIFFVQILLERISSPWEPNFAAIPSLQLFFSPQNAQPKLPNTNGQIQVGQGRLFFIRPPSSNSPYELGWLELQAKAVSSGNLPSAGWTGRVDLDQLEKNGPVQMDCALKCTSGPSLTAHLVLNLGEVEQKMAIENLGKELAEKGIQTERLGRKAEIGTQTMEEEKNIKKDGEEQQFSRKTMLRLMVLMMLKAKRAQNGQEKSKPKMESRSTLTRLSIPPRGDELFKMLTNRKRTEIGQCRARIAYLSALHRTMVPVAKEPKREKNLRKMKKREIVEEIGRRGRKREDGNGRNDLRIMKVAPRIGETILEEGRRSSSSSSGLQSMAMESGRGTSEEEGQNVGKKVGFKSEKVNDEWKTENEKRNEGKTMRKAIGQNIQKQRQIGEQSLKMGGSRFATLNTKNINNRIKSSSSSSSSSSPSAASQQVEHSSGQSNNGTKGKSRSESKSSSSKTSSSSSSSSSSQHSESKSKSSKFSSISSGQKNGSAIQSSESVSRSRTNSKTDSSITEMVASSVKTDSSVPIEIQSVAASSSFSDSGTIIGDVEKAGRRQSSTSKFLHDLRKGQS